MTFDVRPHTLRAVHDHDAAGAASCAAAGTVVTTPERLHATRMPYARSARVPFVRRRASRVSIWSVEKRRRRSTSACVRVAIAVSGELNTSSRAAASAPASPLGTSRPERSISYELRHAPDFGRHHRGSERDGLLCSQGDALPVRRQAEDVGGVDPVRAVVSPAEPAHASANTQFLRHGLQRLFVRSLAEYNQQDIRRKLRDRPAT